MLNPSSIAALGAATLIPLTVATLAAPAAAAPDVSMGAPRTVNAAAPTLTLPKGTLVIKKKPVIKVTRTSVPKSSCSAPFVLTLTWPTGVKIEDSYVQIQTPPRQSGASITYVHENLTPGQRKIVLRPESGAGWCSDYMVPRNAKPGDKVRVPVQIAWTGWTGECIGGPCSAGSLLLLGLKKPYVTYVVV